MQGPWRGGTRVTERGLRYLGCEMEEGTHSQGHLNSPDSERLHPGGGDRLRKEGSILGTG